MPGAVRFFVFVCVPAATNQRYSGILCVSVVGIEIPIPIVGYKSWMIGIEIFVSLQTPRSGVEY